MIALLTLGGGCDEGHHQPASGHVVDAGGRDVSERTGDGGSEAGDVSDGDLIGADTGPVDGDDVELGDAGADSSEMCQADCDWDGLSDCEEAELGTDPCEPDTDGDGIGDLQETAGPTDPLSADTDGDGVDDGDELAVGLDPTRADTLGDGTSDSERWIVDACDQPQAEPTVEHASAQGLWRVALPAQFGDYSELQISTANAQNRQSAAVFDDATNETSGFVLSYAESSASATPESENRQFGQQVAQLGTIAQDFYGTSFQTHEWQQAARVELLVEVSTPVSARRLRNQLLFAFAPFSESDTARVLPDSGATHDEFRVIFSTVLRQSNAPQSETVTTLAVAPAARFAASERVEFRLRDVTDTTAVSYAGDVVETRCRTMAAQSQAKVDFYWVISYTGAVEGNLSDIHTIATSLVPRLQQSSLDYRLGVTSSGRGQRGRLHNPPAWHTDAASFQRETEYLRFYPNDPVGQTWPFEAAVSGLRYMLGLSVDRPPASERIRTDAQVVTIFIQPEEPQTTFTPSLATNTIDYFQSFLESHSTVFSIIRGQVPNCPGGSGYDWSPYLDAAERTGGGVASLCVRDVEKTLDEIFDQVQGDVSPYVLQDFPVSSTIRVYLDGQWVPRSREDGFDYSPSSNAITFYGTFRPFLHTDERDAHTIAVHYDRWANRIKEHMQ